MLTEKCPKCNRRAESIRKVRSEKLKSFVYTLKCGHVVLESIQNSLVTTNGRIRDSLWNDYVREYQREGIEFAEQSNYNCLIGDDMGLGKTIQALLAVKYAAPKLFPTLIIVKSSLKHQWAREVIKWVTSNEKLAEASDISDPMDIPFIVTGGRTIIPAGFKWYIISMDTVERYVSTLQLIGFKCVIIDEVQSFKESSAKRTKALRALVQDIPHRMCLSGTPILNRASEYFTTLNLIDPRTFYNQAQFNRTWCNYDWSRGRYTHIHNWLIPEFQRVTAPYIIRRLKSDVAKDLPAFSRYLQLLDIDNPLFQKEYEKGRRELVDFLDTASELGILERYQHLLVLLTKLRQIVGMAKVEPCVEIAKEFLESTDRKLAIGIHHKTVGDYLTAALAEYGPVRLTGDLDASGKDKAVRAFTEPSSRVLVASTLAAGEGLNLQMCGDAILLERQWNSAKEVQFEGRFNRIGQTNPVTVTYLIVRNSLDEWLTELIENKRHWVNSAMDTEEYDPDRGGDVDYMELAQLTAARSITNGK